MCFAIVHVPLIMAIMQAIQYMMGSLNKNATTFCQGKTSQFNGKKNNARRRSGGLVRIGQGI